MTGFNKFVPWNGTYQKRYYIVRYFERFDFHEVRCFPDNGVMKAVDGSGRSWLARDGILIKPE